MTIFGTIFANLSSIKHMVDQDQFLVARLIRLLGSQLPPVAMYYITYIVLKYVTARSFVHSILSIWKSDSTVGMQSWLGSF